MGCIKNGIKIKSATNIEKYYFVTIRFDRGFTCVGLFDSIFDLNSAKYTNFK